MQCMQNKGYVVERVLGAGAFAQVFLVQHRSKPGKFAVKKIKKVPQFAKNIIQEVDAGRKLDHPNIIKVHDHFEDEEYAYIVTDFVAGSDLYRFVEEGNFQPLGEFHSRRVFKQLVDAVSYCHSNGYVHLDIKLDNIMINRATLKATLIDFGLCQPIDAISGDRITRRVGSEEYTSPEMNFYSKQPICVSGKKVDAWSLGVVLYAMISASFPFSKNERYIIANESIKAKPSLHFNFPISETARDLIEKLLCFDPSKRMSVDEISSHPWMSSEFLLTKTLSENKL